MLHPVVYLILLCLCLQSTSIVAAGDVKTRNEVTSAGVKGPQLVSLSALLTKGVSSPRRVTSTSTNPNRSGMGHLHHLSKMHPNTTNNVEFITNREFITRICDYTYATRTAHNPLSVFVTQTADGPSYKCVPSEVLPNNSIICVRGDAKVIEGFFTEGKCFQRAPYTLVSLETDDSSPFKAHWVHSKNLKKWYGWNAHANSGVIPIPIGLNSDSMLDPLRHARITPWTEKEHKVLLAFKSHTSERSKLNRIAKELNFTASWSYKPTYKSVKTQLEMYESMSKFKFVACPTGTGVDTHRLWEALYLGSVPIVLRGQLSAMYENLPVIQLNAWEDLTQGVIDTYRPIWHFSLIKDYPFVGNISNSQLQEFRKSWKNSPVILDTWITRIRGEPIKEVLLPANGR